VTLPAPLLFFLVYLLTFHAWISYQGFSTYEYILWKRLRDRLRAKTKVRYLIPHNTHTDWRAEQEGVRELGQEDYS